MSDFKERVQLAIEKHLERQKTDSPSAPKRKNEKPEKLVEREVMAWFKANKFDVNVYESKSKFVNGRWQNAGMAYGTCDIQGTDSNGFAVFCELKAPGKRSTFYKPGNDRQVQFILDKINNNAFAVVVDSVDKLQVMYNTWLQSRSYGLSVSRQYLMDCLPRKPKREQDDGPLFP